MVKEQKDIKRKMWNAQVAQSVEHVLGKDEVGGSIPLLGFILWFIFAGNSQKGNY
jgi:hypothetical protein